MQVSMYNASVPVFTQMLNSLAQILALAEAHAQARKIDPAVLLSARLYPDMFPLSKQVQIAADNAKGAAARLAGVEPPKYEDDETSFGELIARVRKTIAYVETLTPSQIDGSDERPVTLVMRSSTLNFTGAQYLLHYALPNFYFHLTTAYAILRHCGVEVGKKDFLGKV